MKIEEAIEEAPAKSTPDETDSVLADIKALAARTKARIDALIHEREKRAKDHETRLREIAASLKALGYHKSRAKKAAKDAPKEAKTGK
jgi:Holliday junction resolvasome RuvABC DNA-binding subunit